MHREAVPLVDRLAMGAIIVAAGARVMISFSPIAVFDMDPAIDASPFIGATPAESVLLDALALAGASWLLVKRLLSRARVDLSSSLIGLACIPSIALAIFHGMGDAEQLWRGSTWVAGIAIAWMMVVQGGGSESTLLRRTIVASLAGIAVVMAVRGIAQLTSEHISTVAYYTENRDTFLRGQGWLADSPQALSYERRLFQNEATGWFGFANVFATVAAGSAVLMANVAIGRGVIIARAWIWFCTCLCAGLVIASGSKGGVAALAIGLIVTVLLRKGAGRERLLFVALPIVVLCAIVFRGLIGLQWGEQSLLFRWQYLMGATGTVLDSPWTGVGPAGFQAAFMQFRPSESVEEVVSAHGAFADWMVAFGCAGAGLVAFQLLMAWRSAHDLRSEELPRDVEPIAGVVEMSIAAVVFAAVVSIAFEAPSLDLVGYGWRFIGLGAGAVTAWAMVRIMEFMDSKQRLLSKHAPADCTKSSASRAVGIGLSGFAAVVLTHGQIDMVFWLPGSAIWGWLVLGTAAWWNWHSRSEESLRPVPTLGFTRVVMAGFACIFAGIAFALASVVSPALIEQDEVALKAAESLQQEARVDSSERLAMGRARAGASLVSAAQIWPPRPAYALRAAEQWKAAASCDPLPVDSPEWLRSGMACAQSVAGMNSSSFSALLLMSTIALREAEISSGSWRSAELALREVLAVNPRHSESWIRLSLALAKQGDTLGARAALNSALESNETYALDPLRQFSADRRASIERQMSELK